MPPSPWRYEIKRLTPQSDEVTARKLNGEKLEWDLSRTKRTVIDAVAIGPEYNEDFTIIVDHWAGVTTISIPGGKPSAKDVYRDIIYHFVSLGGQGAVRALQFTSIRDDLVTASIHDPAATAALFHRLRELRRF